MRTSFRNLTAGERAAFIGKYLFMGLCSLVALFPIVWVIMSSFKTNAEILSNGIGLPSSLSPDGYISALTISPILKYFGNSVVITVITTVLNVLFLAMAAYVFARARFRGKNLLYFILSLSLVVPTTALLQPVYSVVNTMGLYDTKMGLILVYTAINMPMSLLILRGTFQSIPRALEEAGGVAVLTEMECSGQTLFQAACAILHDEARRRKMEEAMAALGIRDAAERIYQTVLELQK